jgi:integrase
MARPRTGSLIKRGKKGTYYLRYQLNGKLIQESLHTTIKSEAEIARDKIMLPLQVADETATLEQVGLRITKKKAEQKQLEDSNHPPITIKKAWETYLESTERPDSGERTLNDYKCHWTKFTKWLSKEHPRVSNLNGITPAIASEYASNMIRDKASPNTFNKRLNFLKLLCETLAHPAQLQANPFEKIKRKKLKTVSKRELTIEELRRILDTGNKDLKLLLMLGLHTGLRLGDCATLKWGEVDLQRMLIRRIPNKTRSRSPKPVVAGITASLYSELNAIPQNKRTGYVLPAMASDYEKDAGLLTNLIQEHFENKGIQTHRAGTGFEPKPDPIHLGEFIKVHTGKRAVVEVGFHSLRHTFVSLHAEHGTPQAVIQAIVGHGSPAMTAHYTHIGEDTARRAAGVLDSGIKDAEFEEVRPPLPKWAKELIEKQNSKNWKKIQKEVLA